MFLMGKNARPEPTAHIWLKSDRVPKTTQKCAKVIHSYHSIM